MKKLNLVTINRWPLFWWEFTPMHGIVGCSWCILNPNWQDWSFDHTYTYYIFMKREKENVEKFWEVFNTPSSLLIWLSFSLYKYIVCLCLCVCERESVYIIYICLIYSHCLACLYDFYFHFLRYKLFLSVTSLVFLVILPLSNKYLSFSLTWLSYSLSFIQAKYC